MRNTFGNSVSVTIYGESHGREVGVVIDGLSPGIPVDFDYIKRKLDLRKPQGNISTKRVEADEPYFKSGVYKGVTTGTPLCISIENTNVNSSDYERTKNLMRPGHADYTALAKYHGFSDFRGGGHFSGRLTTPIVAAGALVSSALEKKGIFIGTHIKRCRNITDREFEDYSSDIKSLGDMHFAVLDRDAAEQMKLEIEAAANAGDSVGGILETAIIGLPAGVGEPWFDSIESVISHGLFSIPAVKGVEFGIGFGFASLFGSEVNDEFYFDRNTVKTRSNNNGGINGGITNGMPVIFRTVIKPTSSIYKPQNTVDISKMENTLLEVIGRHDPAIFPRARVVVDSVAALCVCDLLTGRFGTDWLG